MRRKGSLTSMRPIIFIALLCCCTGLMAAERLLFTTLDSTQLAVSSELVLREAYAKLGIDIQVRKLPGKRALMMSKHGLSDGELIRIKGTDERHPNLLYIPIPLIYFEGVAFSTNSITLKSPGWKGVKPYRLGVLRGVQFSEKPTREMNRVQVDQLPELFKMLLSSRIDLAIYDRLDGEIFLAHNPEFSAVKELAPPIVKMPLYHYLHESHEALVEPITRVLTEMQMSGRIDEITAETKSKLLSE